MHILKALVFASFLVVSDAILRRNAQGHDEETPELHRQPKIRLVYKHMSKCGGVSINKLLKVMTPRHYLVDERTGLVPIWRKNAFVIASTRNPCDYYVSLWAYQHNKDFAKRQHKLHGFFENDDFMNASSFRAWLAWVEGPRFSVMTSRFYETLVKKKNGLSCWRALLGSCTKRMDNDAIASALEHTKASELADCWVHTETLTDDLRHCLVEYERVSGVKLNWDAFNSTTTKSNPSKHMQCEAYYTPEASAAVLSKDKWIFDNFGYTTCCGQPTHHVK